MGNNYELDDAEVLSQEEIDKIYDGYAKRFMPESHDEILSMYKCKVKSRRIMLDLCKNKEESFFHCYASVVEEFCELKSWFYLYECFISKKALAKKLILEYEKLIDKYSEYNFKCRDFYAYIFRKITKMEPEIDAGFVEKLFLYVNSKLLLMEKILDKCNWREDVIVTGDILNTLNIFISWIAQIRSFDLEVEPAFYNSYNERTLILQEESAGRLVKVLGKFKYETLPKDDGKEQKEKLKDCMEQLVKANSAELLIGLFQNEVFSKKDLSVAKRITIKRNNMELLRAIIAVESM